MDLQNVKNITIPEGNVKNIHDKDGRLLWGAVGYDTKYSGDSSQASYTGKNLLGLEDVSETTALGVTYSVSNGVLSINGKTTSSGRISIPLKSSIQINNGTYYTLSSVVTGSYGPGYFSIQMRNEENDGNIFSANSTSLPYKTNSSDGVIVYFAIYTARDKVFDNYTMKPQIEVGSSVSAWEPFVGGIASPNPSYPQAINVVTGVQTITMSDGTNTHNYSVNLGSTELCKIGTYQDYIYKSGDDWYVHKEIGKVVLDGTEAGWTVSHNKEAYLAISDAKGNNTRTYSNLFTNNPSAVTETATWGEYRFGGTNKNLIFFMAVVENTDLAGWKTWLSSHNTIVYYQLATPTDTKITDNTLIGQLNVVHQFLTRYGYSAIVSGNLPLIIDKTNL